MKVEAEMCSHPENGTYLDDEALEEEIARCNLPIFRILNCSLRKHIVTQGVGYATVNTAYHSALLDTEIKECAYRSHIDTKHLHQASERFLPNFALAIYQMHRNLQKGIFLSIISPCYASKFSVSMISVSTISAAMFPASMLSAWMHFISILSSSLPVSQLVSTPQAFSSPHLHRTFGGKLSDPCDAWNVCCKVFELRRFASAARFSSCGASLPSQRFPFDTLRFEPFRFATGRTFISRACTEPSSASHLHRTYRCDSIDISDLLIICCTAYELERLVFSLRFDVFRCAPGCTVRAVWLAA
jgi:hypothetical protein